MIGAGKQENAAGAGDRPNALAVLESTSAGLWSVANNCTRSDLSTAMRQRAQEFDTAVAGTKEVFDAAREVTEASALSGEEIKAMARLIRALADVGGAP